MYTKKFPFESINATLGWFAYLNLSISGLNYVFLCPIYFVKFPVSFVAILNVILSFISIITTNYRQHRAAADPVIVFDTTKTPSDFLVLVIGLSRLSLRLDRCIFVACARVIYSVAMILILRQLFLLFFF